LFDVTRWVVVQDHLQLTGQDVNLVFEPVAEIPTAAIVGTDWVLESLVNGESVTSVSGNATLLLTEDGGREPEDGGQEPEDGTVEGSTGCRGLSGTWVIAAGEIAFPSLSASGECSAELGTQDSFIVSVLEGGFTAEVTGDRLEVTTVSGEGLVYRSR